MIIDSPIVSGSQFISGSSIQVGNAVISGSLTVTGAINATITGSITSASYANFAETSVSSSFALTASYAANVPLTASNANTASYAFFAVTASYAANVPLTASNANTASYSFFAVTASNADLLDNRDSTTFAGTGSNTFTGSQYISNTDNATSFISTAALYTDGGLRVSKDAYVSGTVYVNNLTVYGTSSVQYTTSSQFDIGANIITVNTATPAIRFGGYAVFDSGSTGTGLTGSLLWDSEKNRWVYSNPSGSNYDGGILIAGPRNTSGLGNEQSLAANYITKGQGGDHITASQIIDNGINVQISGSLIVTGSIVGTATNATSASYSVSSSFAQTSVLAQTASYFITSSVTNATSASYAQTASYFITSSVTNATSASFASTASYVETAQTASYFITSSVTNATSASYALTASYAANVPLTASNANTASFAFTASYVETAQTASFVTTAQTASYVLNAVSSSFALTASYISGSGGGVGFPFSGSAVITGSLLITDLSGSSVRYVTADANGLLVAQTASAAIISTQLTYATAGQTIYPISGGYTTGLVDVFVNGTKLNSTEYVDTSGVNIVLTTGSFVNDVVEFQKYFPASGVTNNALRQVNYFTATAGQTVFSASYTPGLLDVFYNGSKLDNTEYTANSGNAITLATASAAGDKIEIDVYSYQVGSFSGIGGTASGSQIAYFTGTNGITGSPNFTVSGSSIVVTGSLVVSGSGTFVNIGPAVFSGSLTSTQGFTGSFSGVATSASFAQTASSIANLNQNVQVTGSLTVSSTITAQTLNVQQVTSSIVYSSGSNIFGSALGNTQQMTGSVLVTGSFTVATTGTELQVGATGVTLGNTLTDIHNVTGSLRVTGSIIQTGTNVTASFSGVSGFGTTTPRYVVDVQSASGVGSSVATGSGLIRAITAGTGDGILVGQADSGRSVGIGANQFKVYGDDYAIMTTGASPLYLATSGSTRLTVTSTGRVGIGTTSPGYAMEIAASSAVVGVGVIINDTNGRSYSLRSDANSFILRDITASADRITINSSGAATFTNDITITKSSVASFIANNTSANGKSYRLLSSDSGQFIIQNTGILDLLYLTSTGDLGIGAATPSGKIHAVGANASSANNVIYLENSVATVLLRIRNDGAFFTGTASSSPYNNTSGAAANLVVTAAGTLERSTSSIKYKKDVRNYDKGLSEVIQMRPVYYKGKSENDGDKQYAGLIAEEIHDLGLTEFVQYAEDGTPDALAYQNMVALLTKAIQELKAELDQAKAEIEILKNK